MQKSAEFCLPLKSSDFIVQVEHVLFSTRKSPNFLECRAVIGQQSVYTTNLWYRIHAIDIRWPVNFKTNARPANYLFVE